MDIATSLAVLSEHGYTAKFPVDFTSTKGGTSDVGRLSELIERFACEGGLIVLTGEHSLHFGVHPTERQMAINTFYQLRPDGNEEVAAVLEKVFLSLCERLHPQLGQVTNEWGWEAMLWSPSTDFSTAYSRYLSDLDAEKPLPFLFWLTYLAPSYYARMSNALANLRGRHERPCGEGVLIYLDEVPWGNGAAVLRDGHYWPT